MNVRERLFAAIASALNHLENSMNALDADNKAALAKSIWHVVAELEYALFLILITTTENCVASKAIVDLSLKNVETRKVFTDAYHLLREAELLLKGGKFLEAYGNISRVRNCILRIQKQLSKDTRKASKT